MSNNNIDIWQVLLHLWENSNTAYKYKCNVADFTSEIENLYKFAGEKIYGNVVKYGNYNYVFTIDKKSDWNNGKYADYLKSVLWPLFSVIDFTKVEIQEFNNLELKKEQLVVNLYINVDLDHNTLSNFVHKSIGSLPIMITSDVFLTNKKLNIEQNKFELVALSQVGKNPSKLFDNPRQVTYEKVNYTVEDVVLCGHSLWQMIYDIKRTNKSYVFLQFKPDVLSKLLSYGYQHKKQQFAILLNGALFTIPIDLVKSEAIGTNSFPIANIKGDEDDFQMEKKHDKLLQILRRAQLGNANVAYVSETHENVSVFHIYIALLVLLVLLLFLLFWRRKERRKLVIASAISAAYSWYMFDINTAVIYTGLIIIDSMFYVFKDLFSVYIGKLFLYSVIFIVSFFLNSHASIIIESILIPLIYMGIFSFMVKNVISDSIER